LCQSRLPLVLIFADIVYRHAVKKMYFSTKLVVLAVNSGKSLSPYLANAEMSEKNRAFYG